MWNNIESTDLFSSTVTGEIYKINHYFNCDSKVYLITCHTCTLKYCRCCAKKAERGEECKQKYLHEYFLQDYHHGFLNDAQVTLIGKTQASDPTKRECFMDENP